jgi:predicted nucleic acid-binding protein
MSATYLDLAIRLNIPLATKDIALLKALSKCNVLPFEVALDH